MYIGKQEVGPASPPFFLAEMSGNHNRSYEKALSIADAAKAAGASALKLQTYTADSLTIPCNKEDFLVTNRQSPWFNRNLYELYEQAHTSFEWTRDLFAYCQSIDLPCFTSVFDEETIDQLEPLNPCAYKIASFENIHYQLIRHAAQTKRPLLISLGLASEEEVEELVEAARSSGCEQMMLLKCSSSYPAKTKDLNLAQIPYLKEKYGCAIGFSDHTLGNQAALTSIAMGAELIEKHFIDTLDEKTVDSSFSADQEQFKQLVKDGHKVWESIGSPSFTMTAEEKESTIFRRSIYAIKPIKKGEIFSSENIRVIRPGYGLHPRYYDALTEQSAKQDYQAGDRISSVEIRENSCNA